MLPRPFFPLSILYENVTTPLCPYPYCMIILQLPSAYILYENVTTPHLPLSILHENVTNLLLLLSILYEHINHAPSASPNTL
jgi:hypothetical protein